MADDRDPLGWWKRKSELGEYPRLVNLALCCASQQAGAAVREFPVPLAEPLNKGLL